MGVAVVHFCSWLRRRVRDTPNAEPTHATLQRCVGDALFVQSPCARTKEEETRREGQSAARLLCLNGLQMYLQGSLRGCTHSLTPFADEGKRKRHADRDRMGRARCGGNGQDHALAH